VDLEGQLQDAKNQRAALIAQTRKDANDAMTEGSKIVAAGEQDQRRAGEHSKLLKLIAPVDGTVQQLTVHTVGGVVPAAQPLMQIVPKENIVEVEAFLENKDVGFVQVSQNAEVKIDAFDYTKYGTLNAKVKHVSQDAIQDDKKGLIYATKISLDKSSIFVDGKTLPLSAGMSVNVEIKTGTRRVIEYVLSPLVQHQREALHER
jgi:hemolysin D